MGASRQVTPQPKRDDRPLLVIQVKLVRLVVTWLITIAVLGIVVIIDLHSAPTPTGKPPYREAFATLFVVLMPVSFSLYFFARRATRITLTPEHLVFREPGWLIISTAIALASIRHMHVEKRLIRTRHFEYYRDFLVFTYGTEKTAFLRIIAYHSRDLWKLLATLAQLAPHIKFDANIHRFLEDYCDDESTQLTSR